MPPRLFRILLLSVVLGCNQTEPRSELELQSHYAYSVAPLDGTSVLFTGEYAIWRSYRHAVSTPAESGEFHLLLLQPHEMGVLGFSAPQVGIVAQGPRFSPVSVSDTIHLTPSLIDTVSMTIGTGGGTWIGDSGRLIVRQIIDTFLIADFDLWFGIQSNPPMGPLHLTGNVIASGTGNDTIP
jgi:hypothetical protein